MRIGEFLLDLGRRELLRADAPVHLSPKAFTLLAALAEHAPDAVSKERLYERLWPDVFVEEANLKNLVAEIRAALGENARAPRLVRTVHGFGYALRVDAPPPPARTDDAARHRVLYLGREFPLSEGENVVGRDEGLAVVVPSGSVSRRHALVVVERERVFVSDLGSKNGTFVGGRRVEGRAELSDGDEIRVGSVPLVFRSSPSGSTQTL
jgi:DNA-binding winged helix-turn-helix (wHTH) protein